jgi:hypothetical protein
MSGDEGESLAAADGLNVVLPADPPQLTPRLAVILLRILSKAVPERGQPEVLASRPS